MHLLHHDSMTGTATTSGGSAEPPAPPGTGSGVARTLTERALARGEDLDWEQLLAEFERHGPDRRFDGLDDLQLEQRVCQDAAAITAAMCRWLELLGELVRRGIWADQGARTPGVWLSWRLGIDGRTAREHVRVALRLRDLPAVRDRFAAGTLSYSKVRAITRVAVTASEALLLEWADHATAAQLETIVGGLRAVQHANLDERPESEDPRYRHHLRTHADGTATLSVRGPVEDIVALDDGIRLLAQALVADRQGPSSIADPDGGDPDATGPAGAGPEGATSDLSDDGAPPHRVTAADRVEAFCHVVAAAVTSDVPVDTSGLDRHTLVIQIDGRDLATEPVDGPDPVAVRDHHGRIRAMDRRVLHRLACDAGLVTATTDHHGTPLDLGRRRRRTNAALRRAVQLRDRHCTFPGCHATRHLHVHHVAAWSADAGPTDLSNLVLVCSYHHRFIHDRGWHIAVRPDGRHRYSPAGSAEPLSHIGPITAGLAEPVTNDHPSGSAEALAPPGDIDLRPVDLDTAIAVLLHTYTTANDGTAVAA